MRRLLAIVFAFLLLTGSAYPQSAKRVLLMSGVKPYLGFVATRSQVAQSNTAGSHFMNSRSWHIARDNISSLAIILPGWRSAGGESALGETLTYTASVEYPAGTLTQITFNGGSASGSPVDGGQIISDTIKLPVPIPNGANFWIRNYQIGPTQIIFDLSEVWPAGGDKWDFSATSLTDGTLVAGYTYPNQGGGAPLYPLAILGMTKKPSVLLIGDSQVAGGADTPDSSGDTGLFARSVGPKFGYSKTGSNGESAAHFATVTPTNRIALGKYATAVISDFGGNDDQGGSAPVAEAFIQACWAYYSGKQIFQSTLTPRTSSTDAWATVGNQTDTTTIRSLLNTWIRTTPPGIVTYFDTTPVVESSPNSGLWKAPGWTVDGLHTTQQGYLAFIPTINTQLIHYP